MQNVVRNENIFYCVLFFIFFYLPTKNLKLLQLLYLSTVTCFSMFQSLSLDVQPTSLSFFHPYLFPSFYVYIFSFHLFFFLFLYSWEQKKLYDPKNSFPIEKYGGRSIILWRCFCASRNENLVRVKGIMKKEEYEKFFNKKFKVGNSKTWSNSSFCFLT